VEVGFAIPQTFPDGRVELALVRRILARAEALGLHSVWVQEQILGATPSLEPVELLTYAAALTERVRLGAAVLLTTLRGPVHLAKSLGTLDHLSGGRLIVGVGLGGNLPLYPAYGIAPQRRVARFVEGLLLMKALWTEPVASVKGRFWQLDGARMEPKPVQRPHPPIWFGAHQPAAIERAVALGDGFIGAGASSVEEFDRTVRLLRAALERAGRNAETFSISKRVYLAVDEDEARAARRLEDWFGRFYRDAGLARRVAVWGSPERCADTVRRIVASGARLLILNPVFDEAEQLDRAGSELVPALASA
jgi:probable F420-dependent oxidoreductase